MPLTDPNNAARLLALLGPTNTGKTWRAISRMLAHESGMIGFPLRLLARENYDRLVAEKGVAQVALITGEEKIVPPRAKWFCCTVEAMPLSRQFAFVAIDEVQLCADPDRGHIFTDRMLHCRGTSETMFLGSDAMRRILRQLFPRIEIDLRPRLSALSYVGHIPLAKLPPRSAIVAFSTNDVYAIADMLTRRRGGCAIVMGQLSPRTRNAQVALFQNREVDYIVATDAIGMGLNMDVDHVALAAREKFDGAGFRSLSLLEMAQIFGRAGRGLRDGTFGTTGDAAPLDTNIFQNIESHQFPPIERINWRNTDLDFRTPAALRQSLEVPATHAVMRRGRDASDILTLDALLRSRQVFDLASDAARTQLLWEVCQIPDFRKLGDTSHEQLCEWLFVAIAQTGHVPDTWFMTQITRHRSVEGDIETLMQRLTAIRICAYVAAKSDWSRRSIAWVEQTRNVEDALSDALHEKLRARYIDRKAFSLSRHLQDQKSATVFSSIVEGKKLVVEGHQVGSLQGLGFELDPDLTAAARALAEKAGRRAVKHNLPMRIQEIVESHPDAFTIDPETANLSWNGEVLARLTRGHHVLSPKIRLTSGEVEEGWQRTRLLQRLEAALENIIKRRFARLYAVLAREHQSPAHRGLQHQLSEQIGIIHRRDRSLEGESKKEDATRLGDVVYGTQSIFVPGVFGHGTGPLRVMLMSLFYNWDKVPYDFRRVSHHLDRSTKHVDIMSGWMAAGPYVIRLDIAESWRRRLRHLILKKSCPLPEAFGQSLGVRRKDIPDILSAWRIRFFDPPALGKDQYGPICPLLLRHEKQRRRSSIPHAKRTGTASGKPVSSAFAALEAWRDAQAQPIDEATAEMKRSRRRRDRR